MSYPGDQGRPGGAPDEQRAGRSPFAPQLGDFAARPGESLGTGSNPNSGGDPGPGSGPAPWNNDPPPWEQGPSWDTEPVAAGPGGGGRPEDLYGTTGERYFAGEQPGGPAMPGGGPAGFVEPESRGNRPLIIGGALVAGLLLAGVGFAASTMFSDDSEPTPPAAAPSPSAQAPSTPAIPQDQPLVKLRSRATDPSPLTLKEIFGTASFAEKGRKYRRTAWKQNTDCTKVVNGTRFASAIKKGGCTQALRATFTRADGKLIGTIGVLNLRTEKAAKAADKAGTDRDSYLEPLSGSGGTKKIGTGAAVGTTDVRGHYLVLAWVQRPDGKTIPTGDYDLVKSFGKDVIVGSKLATALNYRGYAGKPFTGKP